MWVSRSRNVIISLFLYIFLNVKKISYNTRIKFWCWFSLMVSHWSDFLKRIKNFIINIKLTSLFRDFYKILSTTRILFWWWSSGSKNNDLLGLNKLLIICTLSIVCFLSLNLVISGLKVTIKFNENLYLRMFMYLCLFSILLKKIVSFTPFL